jgi:cytoskeleton protein RodZ
MRLEFSADCWVEVKNEANVNLYGDLGRAGESLELVGTPPFRLLLGYAPGVVLAYNGESVPLAGYSRNNVAALWLGRRQ